MDRPPDAPRLGKIQVEIEPRALLVVAGLPGAGKSTLLRGAEADQDVPVTVLDTDQVRAWLAGLLPARTPYACYRPLAPVLQRLRLVATALFATGPVVMHHQATGAFTRVVLALLGTLSRRPCHLLWVDCTPTEALDGQYQRGRMRLKRSFARHVRRASRVRTRLLAGRPPRGWRTVTVIDRAAAARGLRLLVRCAAR